LKYTVKSKTLFF
jgi:ATP-dependent RNA helicase DDX3X